MWTSLNYFILHQAPAMGLRLVLCTCCALGTLPGTGEGAQKGREVVSVIKELTRQKRQRVKLTIKT